MCSQMYFTINAAFLRAAGAEKYEFGGRKCDFAIGNDHRILKKNSGAYRRQTPPKYVRSDVITNFSKYVLNPGYPC